MDGKSIKLKQDSYLKLSGILIALITSLCLMNIFTGKITFGAYSDDVWDGVSVSTSFSGGNGTQDNPYVISSGADFAYFKQVVEGTESVAYRDKYYVLGNDIDLGGKEFETIGTDKNGSLNIFNGSLDGNGFTLRNIKVTGNSIENASYYGIFSRIDNASISNLNINGINITPDLGSNVYKIGVIAGEVNSSASTTNIKNISISNSKMYFVDEINKEENLIGGMFGSVSSNVTLNNIFLGLDMTASFDNLGIVAKNINSSISNVITNVNTNGAVFENFKVVSEGSDVTSLYNYADGSFKNGDNSLSSSEVINLMKEDLNEKYYWSFTDNSLIINRVVEDIVAEQQPQVLEDVTSKAFAFGKSADISLHASGVEGNTIYVNDLVSDYDYYTGLNYAGQTSDGSIPNGSNSGKYSNLAEVYVKYSGSSISDPSIVGNVSLDEQVSDYVYYKYYPVVDGYITFDLIDNPYADRPNDLAFNGWITDYPGAIVSLDRDRYVRTVKIPVSNGPISITFYANWIEATTYNMTDTNWGTAFNALKNPGLTEVLSEPIYGFDASIAYYSSNVNKNATFPAGAVDNKGASIAGNQCKGSGNTGCTYYTKVPVDTVYDQNTNYYYLNNGNMTGYIPPITGYKYVSIKEGTQAAGLYKQVNIPNGSSYNGYYDINGNMVNGTCNTGGGCTYYEYLQYYDGSGNVNVVDSSNKYYYLATRDTNIVVLRTNIGSTLNNSKPLTLTSVNNGIDYRNNFTFDISGSYIKAGSDLRIEYITLSADARASTGNPTGSQTASGVIYGNWLNLKIGRGINTPVSSGWLGDRDRTATSVIAGGNNNTGGAGNPTNYTTIIESGKYSTLSATNGGGTSSTVYIDGNVYYGSDFDRITGNNSLLDIYFCAAGSWGSYVYAGDGSTTTTATSINTHIKSGSFGTSKSDYSTGVYAGGRGTSGREIRSGRKVIVEGGYIYNLIGGPYTPNARQNRNDTFMYMKGGEVDFIIGGAGLTTTYGNRLISVTGGKVNYSVFGGSNGTTGRNGDAQLASNTFLYIGGHSVIGDDTLINNGSTIFGATSGNIFGAGNGNDRGTTIGSCSNTNIVIDGNTLIKGNVYGGGNYGSVGYNGASTTNLKMLNGTVNGSLYGGGNNNGAGTANYVATINIDTYGGNVLNAVYGGSRTEGTVYGNTNVSIHAGNIANVYGGGEGGYQSANNPGTFVGRNVSVVIGDEGSSVFPTISGNVYGGSAFGSVNGTTNNGGATDTYSTVVTVNNGLIKNSVFGGGKGSDTYTPKVYGNVSVTVKDGNITNVFGGNDAAGSPSNKDYVYLYGGTIGDVYGGGNKTGQNNTNVLLDGATVTNLYGGSNQLGTVTTANVQMDSGSCSVLYGGNNAGGNVNTTNVLVNGGSVTTSIYGGGNAASSGNTNVTVNNTKVNDVFGGGKAAGATTTKVNINNATCNIVYGGSDSSGDVTTSNVTVDAKDNNIVAVYGGNNLDGKTTTSNIAITSGVIKDVFGGGNQVGVGTSHVNVYGGNVTNVYGGSNQKGDLNTSNVNIGDNVPDGLNPPAPLNVSNVYGGNNVGGVTSLANVEVHGGFINNVYGGGNQADVNSTNVKVNGSTIDNLFGGGQRAAVNGNTLVDIEGTTINNHIYGGGDQGIVTGNTEVFVTDSTILGNAYAGGNGATAIVTGNSTINIDGKTIIGQEGGSVPATGCVFGSGNAAATGNEVNLNSVATVNITGGTIYGNVYGGAKMSTVYGKTNTLIGSHAVNNANMLEEDLVIHGTVFGGGESNESGDENYDFSFISVKGDIDIQINGEGYSNANHKFELEGSIFGSGNASSSDGESNIYIKNLGTKDNVSKNISIQRTGKLTIDNSYLELTGATDRTNDYSDIKYSFNRIDLLVLTNNTTLLLQQNANLLKEFYSGVGTGTNIVPATVTIDDDTKTVKRNVDNRIYATPGTNLNITTNQSATDYGKVTGMTFFGMYNAYAAGTYGYGIYGSNYNYGDSANAADIIDGSSYVLGSHMVNHDITVNGFYTNYFEDTDTFITTAFIDPTPDDTIFYRWLIGNNSINYKFSLTASKYSSLGTYELSMMDFTKGDTKFEVVGFNCEGLSPDVSLVDSTEVPKIADTPELANSILGLSMKSETSEWTHAGTTKFLSSNSGVYTGDDVYLTDSQKISPSMMFYLYHAKNITLEGELGTVVIRLRATVPKNEIEFDIYSVTIRIDLVAKEFDDGDAYDASITYNKKYEMPMATDVNITNQSQFSAYYSLYTESKFEDVYGKNNENYHVLTSSYALPVGTQITMFDMAYDEKNPQYYFFNVTQDVYDRAVTQLEQYGQAFYKLSDFVRMASTDSNNHYDDAIANNKYYSSTEGYILEEFLFIVDFKYTNQSGTNLNNKIYLEIMKENYETVINVLGIRQELMKYNLYDSSNMTLKQNVNIHEKYLYNDIDSLIDYATTIAYNQTESGKQVIDTNYESMNMGLNVELYDSASNKVSSSLLLGTTFRINDKHYYVDSDGVWRIKLAGKVSNLNRKIYMTTDGTLPPGVYKIKFTLFASSDGLHNSSSDNVSVYEEDITVVGTDNSIVVDTNDENKVVDGVTGLNALGENIISYNMKFHSVLSNPNIRVTLYKRDITSSTSTGYEAIDFNKLFVDTLSPIDLPLKPSNPYEKLLSTAIDEDQKFDFTLQSVLTSGTYRVVFGLYDNDQLIDEEIEYVIVKKPIVGETG